MKQTKVRVRWTHGLHLRPAARLVRLAGQFRAAVILRCGARCADVRSILALIGLCAVMGTTIEVQASGDDEADAVGAVERFFQLDDDDGARGEEPRLR